MRASAVIIPVFLGGYEDIYQGVGNF